MRTNVTRTTDTQTQVIIFLNLREMKQQVPIFSDISERWNNVAHIPKNNNSTQNKIMGQDQNQNH